MRHAAGALLVTALTYAALGAQGPEGTAVIRGRIVDGVSGRPLAGIPVTLYPQPSGPHAPGIDAQPPTRSAITDLDGAFTVERLVAADYSVSASGSADYLDLSTRITVGDGAQVAVTIRGMRAANVAGHVYDDHGRPVVGVSVRVFSPDASSYGSAATDDLGTYHIARLRSGRYTVGVPISLSSRTINMGRARQGSYQPPLSPYVLDRGQRTVLLVSGAPFPPALDDGRAQVYTTSFAGGASTAAAAQYFELDPGESRTDVDVMLRAVRGTRIAGIVTAPSTTKGIILTLVPQGSRSSYENGSSMATAAEDGTFVFVAAPPGSYTLTASRREPPLTEVSIGGGAPAVSMDDVIIRDREDLWAEMPVTVGDADVDDLVVSLRPGMLLTGRFVAEDDPAYAPPADRAPHVVLAGSARPGDLEADRHLVAASDGTIAMRIRPGSYRVLSASSLEGRTFRTAIVNGVELGDAPLVVGNDPLNDVQFVFTRYETALVGGVTNARGEPLGDGTVVLFPADRARWFRLGESSLGRVVRAANGRYQLAGVAPGDYYVTAIADFEFGVSEQSVAALVGGATRVTIRAGSAVTLDLVLRSPK
jgi:hypothetical protein